MSLPAMKPDRRRLPRTTLEWLAYINFDPDNGGIVLDISEEGLRFHAVAPLEVNTKVSFWFSADKGHIASDGLVVWADTTRRTGGMRFNHLSPEARRQIRNWIGQSSKPLARPTQVAAPITRSRGNEPSPSRTQVAASEALRSFQRWVRAPLRWSEFSRGLVTGLLFALVVITLLSFHTRQRVGGALIWLGERLEPRPEPHVASPPPHESATVAPKLAVQPMPVPPAAAKPASTPHRSDETPASTSPVSGEKPRLPTLTGAAPRVHSKPVLGTAPAPAVPSPSIPSLPLPSTATTSFPVRPEDAHLASPVASAEKILAAKAVDRTDESENAEDILEINSGMPLGRYFEVGKFKDQVAGNHMRDDLEKRGFRTVVLPKRLLWMKSYQVLVGPYRNDKDAQGARRNLQAEGFEPRSPGGHSRQMTLTLTAPWENPFGSAPNEDEVVVTWQAYSAEVVVRLAEAGQTGRTATGKWVELPAKSEYTGIAYTTGETGTRTLLSIQFRGMKQAVMLANSADRSIVF